MVTTVREVSGMVDLELATQFVYGSNKIIDADQWNVKLSKEQNVIELGKKNNTNEKFAACIKNMCMNHLYQKRTRIYIDYFWQNRLDIKSNWMNFILFINKIHL